MSTRAKATHHNILKMCNATARMLQPNNVFASIHYDPLAASRLDIQSEHFSWMNKPNLWLLIVLLFAIVFLLVSYHEIYKSVRNPTMHTAEFFLFSLFSLRKEKYGEWTAHAHAIRKSGNSPSTKKKKLNSCIKLLANRGKSRRQNKTEKEGESKIGASERRKARW